MSSLIRQNVNEMTGYVPGEQPKDPELIKLNTNENPYPPSPRVAACLKNMGPEKLRLYPDPVSSQLREKVAEVHNCSAANVFVGNGSDEVLALCTRAFVENDGAVGYFVPSYSLYPILTEIRNVEQRPVDLGEGFSWSMPEEHKSDLFFLANPNAPTSLQYDRDLVYEFCKNYEGVVLVDEAYVDFASYDCVDMALELPNVIVARTLSKSFSLAGLRVGYALGSAELVTALYKIKDSYNLDRICQDIAYAALDDIEYMRGNAEKIKATRAKMTRELERMGFKVYDSDTNFLWVECCDENAKDFFDRMRRNKVLVRYFPGDRTGDCVRITVGTDEEADAFLEIAGGQ